MKDSKKAEVSEVSKQCKKVVREYDESLKRRVVEAITQEGMTLYRASKFYNIPDSTIGGWIKKLSSEVVASNFTIAMTPEEEKEVEALKKEKEQMAKALQDAQLKISSLETLISVAEKNLKIDIRKKSGSKQSN